MKKISVQRQAELDRVHALVLEYREPDCGETRKRRIESAIFHDFEALLANKVRRAQQPGIDTDDLISAAYKGLGQALQQYEPSYGRSFPTYAGEKIFNRIREAVSEAKAGTNPVIRHIFGNHSEYSRIAGALPAEADRPKAYEKIADRIQQTGIGERYSRQNILKNIKRYFEEGAKPLIHSLDAPIDKSDPEAGSFIDHRIDPDALDPADITQADNERAVTLDILNRALASIMPRDAEILTRRVNEESLASISHDMAVSIERIRQIEVRATGNAARAVVDLALKGGLSELFGIDMRRKKEAMGERPKRGPKPKADKVKPVQGMDDHACDLAAG